MDLNENTRTRQLSSQGYRAHPLTSRIRQRAWMFLKLTIDHRTSYYLSEKVLDCEEFGLKCHIADCHMKIIAKELEYLMLKNAWILMRLENDNFVCSEPLNTFDLLRQHPVLCYWNVACLRIISLLVGRPPCLHPLKNVLEGKNC